MYFFAHLDADVLDRFQQAGPHGVIQAVELLRSKRRALEIRVQPHVPQNLVGVAIAGAGLLELGLAELEAAGELGVEHR